MNATMASPCDSDPPRLPDRPRKPAERRPPHFVVTDPTFTTMLSIADTTGLAIRSDCMQNACMTSITIRDVPDEVRDELAARARSSGRSLQEYLKAQLVELANRPDPAALIEQARERTIRTGSRLDADRILAHRDHDRR